MLSAIPIKPMPSAPAAVHELPTPQATTRAHQHAGCVEVIRGEKLQTVIDHRHQGALRAQVPISVPTAKRMKIAVRPLETPSTTACRTPDYGMPFLVAMPAAIRPQQISAIWFGPCDAFSR